jgi:hypothetical protein
MGASDPLTSGLDAFALQFKAQAGSVGLPASEHAVHFCLALGLQAAWVLRPGDIVFEHPAGTGARFDLWVREPYHVAIEVRYLRSHASGSQPTRPMHYGQLADFNKVVQVRCRQRLIVLAADDGYLRYIEQSGRSLLPLQVGSAASISASSLDRLADTPRQRLSPAADGAICGFPSAGPRGQQALHRSHGGHPHGRCVMSAIDLRN